MDGVCLASYIVLELSSIDTTRKYRVIFQKNRVILAFLPFSMKFTTRFRVNYRPFSQVLPEKREDQLLHHR